MQGGKGESERAGEKEIKRRRERGKGAVGSSNRQWQDQEKCSKDVSLFKVDIPQVGQSSTLVPESSLLPGLTPKMCPLQSLLHTGRQV